MKNALIVVDYQNDFVDGSLGFPEALKLESPIAKKIEEYHKRGDDVLFTLDMHDSNYQNTKEWIDIPILHCIKNTKGCELYGTVAQARQPFDHCFHKSTYGSSELFSYLCKQQYSTIEFVGILSNICVISNAILAQVALPETSIIIDARSTASNSKELHQAALAVMEGLHMKILR